MSNLAKNQKLELDTFLGEEPYIDPAREQEKFKEIADFIVKGITFDANKEKKRDPHQRFAAVRDAHPKSTGCVEAEFQVVHNLPPDLAHGIFKAGKKYRALIRFSNGNANRRRPDIRPDARGMAIKVFDVDSATIFPEGEDAKNQDFVMINHPVFFVDDPDRYLKLNKQINDNSLLATAFKLLASKFEPVEKILTSRTFKDALEEDAPIGLAVTSKVIASPLQERYWSMSAYRLGEGSDRQAIKFSALPLPEQEIVAIPDRPSSDFLRKTLTNQLKSRGWQFEFKVQPRTSDRMSVENTRDEWPEQQAPFISVATINISPQDVAKLGDEGERRSFSPWHTLPAHRPLGLINRMRAVVYQATAQRRRTLNR